MTLEDFKNKVYSLIEEYSEEADDLTEDTDLSAKFHSVTNAVMNDVARMKKLDEYTTYKVVFEEGEDEKAVDFTEIADNIYQINIIRGIDSEVIGNKIIFHEEGTAKIYYYKYPTQIDVDTDDSYTFELDNECLEIMMYGVAGDLLKSDVSSSYGKLYSDKYEMLLQRLDPRRAMPSIYIEGGISV
jgi:hypothetical protein